MAKKLTEVEELRGWLAEHAKIIGDLRKDLATQQGVVEIIIDDLLVEQKELQAQYARLQVRLRNLGYKESKSV